MSNFTLRRAVPATGTAARTWPVPRPDRSALAIVAVIAAAAYLIHPPAVPDLAAQVARVDASRAGSFVWWDGWFGGLALPAYSALSPLVMARLGVSVAAVLSALGATALAYSLFRQARRPMIGAAMFSAAAFADILAGRITFALGATAAAGAIVLLLRGYSVRAAVIALLSFLFSPLAGLFLGLVAVGIAVADPTRRKAASWVAGTLLVASAAQAVIFPGGGEMPYPWWHMAIAFASVAVVGLVCPSRTVRVSCAVVAASTILFYLVPSPVGTNIVRLVWLAAAPTVAACGRLRRIPLVLLVLALVTWPAIDLGIQLDRSTSPASQSAFFSPMIAAWHQQAAIDGATAVGERVELVNPASQWGAAYVAPVVPIARGWDRATDRTDNALFYTGNLTSADYHTWLKSMSVGWVALPLHVPLDYASKSEAQVVQSRPNYLRLVWQDQSWQLFRVVGAAPLIAGATLVQTNGRDVVFRAAHAGAVNIQMRWSPYLEVRSQHGAAASACIIDRKPWTRIVIPSPGTYTLSAGFVLHSASHSGSCGAT